MKISPSFRPLFKKQSYPTIISNSSHAVNRIIIAAKAFGTCGLVLHDEKSIATSRKLIAHALTLRDKDWVAHHDQAALTAAERVFAFSHPK